MYYSSLMTLLAVGAYAQSATTDSTAATITRMSSSSGSGLTDPTPIIIYGLDNTINTYAASVVNANQAATTYNVRCIAGLTLCPNDDFLLTQASNFIHLDNIASTGDITAAELLTCDIAGTTSASCLYTISARSGSSSDSASVSTAYSSATELPHAIVTVTAGQVKLATASNVSPQPTTPNAAYRASFTSTRAEKGMLMTMLVGASAALVFAIIL